MPKPYDVTIGELRQSFETFPSMQSFVASYVEPVIPPPNPNPIPPVGEAFPTQEMINDRFIAQIPYSPDYVLGTGYPEPRNFLEAQWHSCQEFNLDSCRHLHVGLSTPREISGWTYFDIRLIPFHYAGTTISSISATWRGGNRIILLPATVKSSVPGLLSIPITDDHPAPIIVPMCIDTRMDVNDGARALEIDVKLHRPNEAPVNIRLLAGTIFVRNGKATVTNVGGAFGAEGWTSSTDTGGSTTGYMHVDIRNLRRFDTEPELINGNMLCQGLNSTRIIEALVTVDPNLHTHPPSYGQIVVPMTRVQWSGTPPSIKWKPILFNQPTLNFGQRLMARISDTGKDANGNPVMPEAAATLFVCTIGKGV